MDLRSRLEEIKDDPALRLMFVASSGAMHSGIPDELRSFAPLAITPDMPLDEAWPEDQSIIVGAFAHALSEGYTRTHARIASGALREIEIYNELDDYGCLVALFSTTDRLVEPSVVLAEESDPPARRTEMCLDAAGRVLSVGDDFEAMFGFDAGDVGALPAAERVHPDDRQLTAEAWARVLSSQAKTVRIRRRSLCKDGSWIWCDWTFKNLLHLDDPHVLTEAIDVDREMQVQVELERREALLVRLTEALPVGVVQLLDGDVVALSNQRWTELTGQPTLSIGSSLAPEASEAQPALEQVFDAFRNASEVEEMCRLVLATGEDATVRVLIADDSTTCTHGDLLVRRLLDEVGDATLLLTLTDVSESVALHARLQFEARNDHLTSILNRQGLEERVESLLRGADERDGQLAMLYLDLDGFKAVNDRCGHRRGDEVLQQLAIRLSDLVRDGDFIGRLGGDEFVVVAHVETEAEAEAMQRRIQSRLRIEVLPSDGPPILVTSSVGVAIAEPGDSFPSLTNRADAAMYQLKDRRSTDV